MNIKGSLIFQFFHVNGDKKMVLLQKDPNFRFPKSKIATT